MVVVDTMFHKFVCDRPFAGDQLVVETQLSKLRHTSDTLIEHACAMFQLVFVNYIYDMVVDTQFHKFYGRPFARVLYLFLMKDIGR